ncbi:DUF3224 domain-containing protein [Sorangium sp. So ce291]|uniref:DUF3224 domain-containing protein n=1 Tax=Sorangium sp. So ce291 TaxID=3133294 RepID=UPI003F623728
MRARARGQFKNVATSSAAYDTPEEGPELSRVAHDRALEGDLIGTSKAELHTCLTGGDRFGYVGTDRFSGSVAGRRGTFVFQHGGVRQGGELRSFGFIVPGSGTGDLAGIQGSATISVDAAGTHALELDYDFV